MFNFQRIFYLFFSQMPPSEKMWETWQRSRDKQLVQRYSNGNIRLQMGAYMTEAELEAKKASVLAYRF